MKNQEINTVLEMILNNLSANIKNLICHYNINKTYRRWDENK